MRHFGFLDDGERDRLFALPPAEIAADQELEQLAVALGATLYCPAVRPDLAGDLLRCARRGVRSVVVCLEDSVPDAELDAAERNLITQLRALHRATEGGAPDGDAPDGGAADPPLLFVRVRSVAQIPMLVAALGPAARALTGFVLPKFDEHNGAEYLEAVVAAGDALGRRLLAMPVFESGDLGRLESRTDMLLATRQLLDKHRAHVLALRIGATDLSATYGLRRPRDFTVWDIRVVADAIGAVVNVFGRVTDQPPYVITGPVWEYFSASERMFKPQLREAPFIEHQERSLRAELIAADLDGLIREVVLDRANGLTGKTVIHPSHVPAVHALQVVAAEEYADALDVLATGAQGGAAASSFGNKMNESKPHTAWAARTVLRARAFGVSREHISFVDLLAAGLHA